MFSFLASGRKHQLTLIGVVAVISLGIAYQIPMQQVLEYVTIIISVGIGGIAIEDSISGRKKKPCPPTKKPSA